MNHFAAHVKLTQHCILITLQLFKKERNIKKKFDWGRGSGSKAATHGAGLPVPLWAETSVPLAGRLECGLNVLKRGGELPPPRGWRLGGDRGSARQVQFSWPRPGSHRLSPCSGH